jgi:hypothetical protein
MQKVRSSNLKQDTRTPGDGPRGGYSYHPTGSPAISYPAARYCPPHRSRHAARYRAVLCAQPLHRRPPPLRRIGPGAGKYRIVAGPGGQGEHEAGVFWSSHLTRRSTSPTPSASVARSSPPSPLSVHPSNCWSSKLTASSTSTIRGHKSCDGPSPNSGPRTSSSRLLGCRMRGRRLKPTARA